MYSPTVSILLPVWNAASTLPTCLKSIFRQSLTDWECLLVDDGSTDESLTLAHTACLIEPRLRLLEGPHQGLVPTLNRGLQACRGRYVARMDADDVMHSARLEAQVAALEADSGLAGVGCGVRLFPRALLRPGLLAYERWLNQVRTERLAWEAFIECPLAHPTFMLRREVFQAFGYQDHGWPEDYDLIRRLLASGHALGVVPQRLLLWREGPSRLSRTHAAYQQARFTACRAALLADTFLKDVSSYVLWGHGKTGKQLANALEAHGKRVAALVDVHPRRLGAVIRGVRVLPYTELPRLRGWKVVASVAGERPRGLIREAMAGMGFAEGVDFVCAA